jgi:hypothetical protein
MNKLSRLNEKESSQILDGVYRLVVDLHVSADKKITLGGLEKELAGLGGENLSIERYAAESPFNIGDEIELTAEFTCDKSVYQDSNGNLTISDKPVEGSVEKIGVFRVSLPAGTIAEVNKKSVDGSIEVLFTGESIYLDDISRIAYLGILALPTHLLAK